MEILRVDGEAKIILKPMEGIPFEVNPLEIDRNLFKQVRGDSKQELTRQLILEAFAKVDEYPKKYGKPFYTLMPKKTWTGKNVRELIELANNLGDHLADWVEQALEWAQRISNGETWEDVCNNQDTANWYRMVKWKNGYYRLVGGSRGSNIYDPTPDVDFDYCYFLSMINGTVPLVVLYDE